LRVIRSCTGRCSVVKSGCLQAVVEWLFGGVLPRSAASIVSAILANFFLLQIPAFVDHRENLDTGGLDFVKDAVGVQRQFAHVLIVQLWNDTPPAGKLIEP
jgi:hypothetical protein